MRDTQAPVKQTPQDMKLYLTWGFFFLLDLYILILYIFSTQIFPYVQQTRRAKDTEKF